MARMTEEQRRLVRRLRREETPSERLLWFHLRDRRLGGWKFRRQRPLGKYVADFSCDALRLVVEVDGPVHDEEVQREHDAIRDEALAEHGYTVLRIAADDVMRKPAAILNLISQAAANRVTLLPTGRDRIPVPPLPGEGAGGEGESMCQKGRAAAQRMNTEGEGTTTHRFTPVPPLPGEGEGAGGEG
jgi:very-short-patch-repair endonuclease